MAYRFLWDISPDPPRCTRGCNNAVCGYRVSGVCHAKSFDGSPPPRLLTVTHFAAAVVTNALRRISILLATRHFDIRGSGSRPRIVPRVMFVSLILLRHSG